MYLHLSLCICISSLKRRRCICYNIAYINNVEITEEYLNLKIEELNLAFAYAELKEEEKEEQ